VNLLGDNTDTIQKNIETLNDVSKKVGLEINVGKLNICSFLIVRMQVKDRDIKNEFENVSQLKYLGMTVTDQNLLKGENMTLNSCLLLFSPELLVGCPKT
jgi:hypothetical protein